MTPESSDEGWRPTHIRPDLYEISNQGRVRNIRSGRILKPHLYCRPGVAAGYYQVSLSHRFANIHVLVCWAFNGPRPTPKHCVAHNNGDSRDNRPSNLRWATYRENTQDAIKHGTKNTLPLMRGSSHPFSKLTEDDVGEIRRLAGTVSRKRLASRFGVTKSTIDAVVWRVTWKHVA